MRIAGIRLSPAAARLLIDILEGQGHAGTAAKIGDALKRGVTIEAPLAPEDYEVLTAALSPQCPPSLYKLQRELLEYQRRLRRITGR